MYLLSNKATTQSIMKKILCPTDFSDIALNAVAYAAKFAQVTNAELVLFHVQSLFALSPVELIRGQSDSVELVRAQLEAQCKQISKAFKISCYGEVQVAGAPFASVVTANAADFDLIVMGSNGEDDFYQFFTGSNTYNVIEKAAVPVLLIPWDCEFREINTMVYAYDYLRDGKLPLNQIIGWAKDLNTELRVLEVLEESTSKVIDKELKGLQAVIRNQVPDKVNLTFDTLHASDVADTINEYVLKHDVDVLALCTHHYSFLQKLFHKSVIKALSTRARYPVLVFHE
jgi:nucleotide-binding universal stress UspA family protein